MFLTDYLLADLSGGVPMCAISCQMWVSCSLAFSKGLRNKKNRARLFDVVQSAVQGLHTNSIQTTF